jgi:hypothetical protein
MTGSEGSYRIIAEIMSCLLLSMIITVMSGFLIYIRDYILSADTAGKFLRMPLKIPAIKRKGFENLHVMSATFLISIILMVLFRIRIPMSCLDDFRYIYPVLPPFISFYLFTMQQAGESGHNFLLMILFYQGIIFSACSGLFFLGLPVG